MNKEALLNKLDQIQALSEASRWSRLLRIGPRYISAMIYRFLVYPWHRKGWKLRCEVFWGETFRVVLPAAMDLYLTGAKTHLSEIKLARFLVHHVQAGDTLADIGAHIGYFSRLMAKLCGPGGKVICFEPTPATFALLEENTAGFAQIEPVHAAVGASAGIAVFNEYPLKYSEYNTLSDTADMPDLPAPVKHDVQVLCAADYFAARHLQPRVIKIDVEGGELQVIEGLAGYLRSSKPLLVVELIRREPYLGRFRRIMDLLSAFDYTLYIIGAKGFAEALEDPFAYLESNDLDSDNFVFM